MSTAIIISGQARSFSGTEIPSTILEGGNYRPNPRATQPWARSTRDNQRWYVWRKFKDPWFFVSLAKEPGAELVEPYLLKFYPRSRVFVELVDQPVLTEPPVEALFNAPYCVSSPRQSILRDLWHRQNAWRFCRENYDEPFEMIVRLRPDLFFQRFNLPPVFPATCHVPPWASYGGVNDRLAVMGPGAAETYFNAYARVAGLLLEGCPFHPETLTAEALIRGGIEVRKDLDASFVTLRPNGEIVWQQLHESILGDIEGRLEGARGHRENEGQRRVDPADYGAAAARR